MPTVRKTGFRVFFNAISVLVLFSLFYNPPFDGIHQIRATHERFMQERTQICDDLIESKLFDDYCVCLLSNPDHDSGGFFNYIKFFYCDCKNHHSIGYLILLSWLAILFYLLGNTASDYFCCSLEKLSDLLNLSPTVAGVTLLPLGNGATDVFASISAFVSSGSSDVGFNTIMGGALFITCVVVGVVSFSIADKRVQIDRKCFIRDLSFFLFSVMSLALILVFGVVNIWGAMCFLSIYFVYAIFVAVEEFNGLRPLNPEVGSSFSGGGDDEEEQSMGAPLLVEKSENISAKLSNWNVSIYSDFVKDNVEDVSFITKLCSILEIPLHIPRRLTIPIVEEHRWSKTYAICSAFSSPIFLAFLWNSHQKNIKLTYLSYFLATITSITLGLLAFFHTSRDHPPRRGLFPWVFGGFFMSITWFYIIAHELVSLLVSFGHIFTINPSILALTILAWGNSMGDLMSNTSLAMNQKNGVQIAMSGCYAGPMFNTLVGLGVSLVLVTWSMGSVPYVLPRDSSLFITLGFLAAALVWPLIVLPLSDMRPNKLLGFGLIAIYLLFLCVWFATAMSSGLLGVSMSEIVNF